LTGYRQSDATEPCVALAMSVSLLVGRVSMLHKSADHYTMSGSDC
jgi:hypothetical protein